MRCWRRRDTHAPLMMGLRVSLNWTQVLFPGLVLALLVLALSFVGDGLQEYVERG